MSGTGRSWITVVSGLPRSGTSLAMRMLEAGGVPVLCDGQRPPDAHNPHGYFELEAVKRLPRESAWLAAADGKAVKVVYRLLPALPPGPCYRVVFMERPLHEVFASQQAMLRGAARPTDDFERADFERVFTLELERSLAWLATQPRFRVLRLSYPHLIADPGSAAAALDAFLGGDLDQPAMLAVVDPALYRQRG